MKLAACDLITPSYHLLRESARLDDAKAFLARRQKEAIEAGLVGDREVFVHRGNIQEARFKQ